MYCVKIVIVSERESVCEVIYIIFISCFIIFIYIIFHYIIFHYIILYSLYLFHEISCFPRSVQFSGYTAFNGRVAHIKTRNICQFSVGLLLVSAIAGPLSGTSPEKEYPVVEDLPYVGLPEANIREARLPGQVM
jgi:hypothetical protein